MFDINYNNDNLQIIRCILCEFMVHEDINVVIIGLKNELPAVGVGEMFWCNNYSFHELTKKDFNHS